MTPQGYAEAKQVAAYLQSFPIAHVYTSPLRRAHETAEHITAELGVPVSIEPLLRERMNFGDQPGQTFKQFVAIWEQCSRQRDHVPPVGDSSRGAGQRVEAFVTAVHDDVLVVIVVQVRPRGSVYRNL